MHKTTVGIFGASGYGGVELTKLLSSHPGVELAYVAGDRFAGRTVRDVIGLDGAVGALTYLTTAEAEARAEAAEVVMLGTPAEVSLEMVPRLVERRRRVIDLSGAFRLTDAVAFQQYYKATPPPAALQKQAVYGLPELSREGIAAARVVANPGCYATAIALGLHPFVREGLFQGPLLVSAASGVTGAGRKASEDYSFAEVADDFRPYRVLKHQHTPEIIEALSRGAKQPVELAFTPHLLPVRRGIVATTYARLAKPGVTAAELTGVLARRYEGEPFVTVASTPEDVSLARVVGTNTCLIGVTTEASGTVVVIAAIDNLLKGAAGQAVQNLNTMLGLPETTALDSLRRMRP